MVTAFNDLFQKYRQDIKRHLESVVFMLPKTPDGLIKSKILMDICLALDEVVVDVENIQIIESYLTLVADLREKIANDKESIHDNTLFQAKLSLYDNHFKELRALLDRIQSRRYEASSLLSHTLRRGESQRIERNIFISHAPQNLDYARVVVKMLEAMGIKSSDIYCTSLVGYDIPVEDWKTLLKMYLHTDGHGIVLFSQDFKKNEVSLCEMGALWALGQTFTSILLPPCTDKDMPELLRNDNTFLICEHDGWLKLRSALEGLIETVIHDNLWETKRDGILEEIKTMIKTDILLEKFKSASTPMVLDDLSAPVVQPYDIKPLDERILSFIKKHRLPYYGGGTMYRCSIQRIMKQNFAPKDDVNEALDALARKGILSLSDEINGEYAYIFVSL